MVDVGRRKYSKAKIMRDFENKCRERQKIDGNAARGEKLGAAGSTTSCKIDSTNAEYRCTTDVRLLMLYGCFSTAAVQTSALSSIETQKTYPKTPPRTIQPVHELANHFSSPPSDSEERLTTSRRYRRGVSKNHQESQIRPVPSNAPLTNWS